MSALIDLTGMKFNMLTVIERAESAPGGITYWLCRCDCGNFTTVRASNLKNGAVKSCGCLQHQSPPNKTYGGTGTPLYNMWCSMIGRCEHESNNAYPYYGAKGVQVCDEWHDFGVFRDWVNETKPDDPSLSIDRIDVYGNYEPDNCTWSNAKQQANNRRNNRYYEYNGEIHTLMEWCEIFGLNYGTIHSRIYRNGWPFEQAITTPILS